ncbi:MAG: RNA polymerase sigma factor [Armatimonadota bacterium]|nr:RNA polymerase sigma factor [Armatimonadota bacterium]MDR7421091.1 RNA polymerase sigma factor [Armatimonadota bacterium]MDR7453223.1 RNA polymerase sigma factor [Armatimonadota bacterium]MDR7455839.1 RNA polymerase sigma factor [Armatimonadota bacterium]MDR7497081.1 RNA polymerase sigma factor [Armatimonadota bacterium]
MDAEDRQLVEAFRRGEESAFSALVIKYRDAVYRVARRMLGNHEDAADVTQEVFIRAYRALARFDGRSRLYTWLYRITVNLCLDWRTRLARLPLADGAPEPAPAPTSGAPEVEARETVRAVARAVAALPPRQRAMVVLRLYQDLPYQDIARIMGCSEGTVKATMFAALRRLRRLLVAEGVAP